MKDKKIIIWLWQLSKWHWEDVWDYQELIKSYVQKWYTHFDCADIYEWTEELLGNIRKQIDICVNTKHVPDLQKVLDSQITQEYVKALILRSQERLNTHSLNNVQFHRWDYKKNDYKVVINSLQNLQTEWNIQNIGITNTNTSFLKELAKKCDFIPYSTQNQYSIIDRRPEKSLISHVKKNSIKLFCYGSLMWGLLTDKYLWISKPIEPLVNRSLRKYLVIIDDWGGWELFQLLLQRLHQISLKHNVDIARTAISWVIWRENVSAVILWISKWREVERYDDMSKNFLTEEDLVQIDEIYNKWRILEWDVFDLERESPRHRDIMKFNLNKK